MVTAQEIRSAQQTVTQQQRDLARTTRQLEQQQSRLRSAQAVRGLPREVRQLETRRLGGFQAQIGRGVEQLRTTQTQLQDISRQLQTQQQQQSRLDRINRIFKRIGTGRNVGAEFSKLSRADQNLVTKTIGTFETRAESFAEREAIKDIESQLQQSLPQVSRTDIIQQIRAGRTQINIPTIAGVTRAFTPIPISTLPSLQAIAPAPALKGLSRQIVNVEKQLFQLEKKPIEKRTTSEKLRITGLQAKLDTLSVAQAATRPVKTVKGVGRLVREVGEFAISAEGKETPLGGISQALRTRPEATTIGLATLAVGALNLGKITKLTSLNRLKASNKAFIVEKPAKGFKKTPLSKAFPEEVKLGIDDKKVISFLETQFRREGGNFNNLGKIEQNFLVGQVKARIRNNPQLFIPKARQEALKRLGVKDLKQFTTRRLKGDFPQLILKEQLRRGDLTELQRATLGRISQNLEKERIRKAIDIKPRPIKPSELLSSIEKEFILKQLNVQIRARKLDLTPAQRTALQNAKTQSELARVRKAIFEGRKPIRADEFLSTFEKNNIISQIQAQVRASPELRLTTAQRIALRRAKTKSELDRVRRAIERGSDDLLPSDLISKAERAKIERQFGAAAVAGEAKRFGPKQILVQKPIVEIKSAQLTSAQQALLRRLRESKTTQARAIQEVRKAKIVEVPRPEALRALQQSKQQQKVIQKQLQVEGQRLKKAQSSRQAFVTTQQGILDRMQTRLKTLQVPLLSVQRTQALAQIQQQRQVVSQAQKLATRQALQFQSFFSAVAQAQGIAQPQRFAQRVAQRSGLALKKKPKLIVPGLFKIPKTGLLKRTKKQIRESKTQGYNAFAKPQGSKKFVKLNTKPLSKRQAKSTMAFFVDRSLSASGKIDKTKGKIKVSRLGISSNYFENNRRKFREFKIRKGKPIFTPNKFIEFRSRRLDTIQEQKKIKLAALVARKRKAVTKRIPPPKFKRV